MLDFLALASPPPQTVAVIDPTSGECVTYSQLRRRIAVLQELFDGPDKLLVVVEAARSISGIACYLATLGAGHTVLPLDGATEREWQTVLGQFRPDLVLHSGGAAPTAAVDAAGYRPAGAVDGIRVARSHRGIQSPRIHPELAALLRTSGSLGTARTVRLSYRALRSNALAIVAALGMTAADRGMTSLPLGYSFGLSIVNSHFAVGGSIAVTSRSPTGEEFWWQVEHAAGSCVGAVPLTLRNLRSRKWTASGSAALRMLLHAGGPLDRHTREYFHQTMRNAGAEFVSMYGQTEATARITCLRAEAAAGRLDSVGQVIPGGVLTIENDAGERLPDGTVGGVVYRGPNVMLGYAWERTDLAAGDELRGVLRTGDVGCLRDGMLYLAGRADRQHKICGRRVNLDEIEAELHDHGFTVAVESRDDVVIAVVTTKAGALRSACSGLEHRFGLPSGVFRIIEVDRIPMTENGKTDRPAVTALLGSRWKPAVSPDRVVR
ncbi:AMP-binding protein [Fodinicola acaciae]|uniref:AMP-binding protein n=1 Tax=Fodinicola acaciae TaxID=2681555 RepID=UPI0013D1E627|nr:AMP-binding protein [Fodinicola acaciae]